MKVTYYHFCHEAFGSVKRQEHAIVDGIYYRIFGEGSERQIRQVIAAQKQPKVRGIRKIAEILKVVDEFASLSK